MRSAVSSGSSGMRYGVSIQHARARGRERGEEERVAAARRRRRARRRGSAPACPCRLRAGGKVQRRRSSAESEGAARVGPVLEEEALELAAPARRRCATCWSRHAFLPGARGARRIVHVDAAEEARRAVADRDLAVACGSCARLTLATEKRTGLNASTSPPASRSGFQNVRRSRAASPARRRARAPRRRARAAAASRSRKCVPTWSGSQM